MDQGSMFCTFPDFPLMLHMKMPVVNIIHPQSNKFATGVENKAIGNSKPNDSLVTCGQCSPVVVKLYTTSNFIGSC